MTDEWKHIDTAPDDSDRPGGQRCIFVKDRDGNQYLAKRTLWNDTGWCEKGTNQEIKPFIWKPAN